MQRAAPRSQRVRLSIGVAAETELIRQSHDAQRLGDGAFAGRQNGAADQHQDMVPDWCGEA